MKKVIGCTVVALVGLCTGLGTGCGTKSTAPTTQVDAKKLPGSDAVMAAIEKKNYDGAIAALMKVSQNVTNQEQQMEFILLTRDVKDKMIEAAPNDPKAAEALAALRGATMGR
jgi:hypothetical protein